MLARFKKEAFLAPNLSIIYPIAYDPAISPTPKRDMATKAFEVNCDLLKSASDVVFLSSNVIAGINKPDQKEIESPVHKIYKFIYIILLLTSILRVLVSSSMMLGCFYIPLALLALTSLSTGSLILVCRAPATSIIHPNIM